MRTINWGIIGLGNIASKFALAFNEVENANLLAIASKNNEKIDNFKKKFKIDNKYCFTDYDEIINCKEIDIVYIALPHNYHFEWIVKCINSNKNVLTEKPATINSGQIKKINKLLDKKKLFFAEGFMYRYHPQTELLIEIIKNNEIGEILYMESFFGNNIIEKKNWLGIKKIKINEKNRLFNRNLAGGSILDLGCYPVSMSTMIANLKSSIDYKSVKLFNSKVNIGPTNVDIDSYCEIDFNNNFKSYVGSSFKKNLGQVTKITGSKGKILVNNSWHCNPVDIFINSKKYKECKIVYKNIFSYEIDSISNSLINNKLTPDCPGVTRHETEKNMEIIDEWIKKNEK